jgi:hypothetical protein
VSADSAMSGEVRTGDRFWSRDAPLMVVTVEGLSRDGERAFVRRNTSRRRQPILVRRLMSRDYVRLSRAL